ncbi:hypothetical protein [Dyadobacter pollutisoli]|jgi:hypothetical protein|uniref:Uncharacterized protein n=1 Tax=Dyadobacter pollutisoli TaxID=2910158 RepID=A0A9E8NAE4_9BACT|nr:hypothetical protein [Dyadobacter pollutisoli]WAC11421.1 hypothetical protein ON006_27270 [Dyadobacter pollutisoli]
MNFNFLVKETQESLLSTDVSLSGYTTFERKAEEMKVFLSHNPIPEEFLNKK